MDNKKNSMMETTTLQRVPDSERRPWYKIAFIWAGSVICIPALMVGSLVTAGLDFQQSVLAMTIGFGIVVAYMCLLGCQSSDLGLPTTVAISRAYGVRGSQVMISLIIAVSLTGWFGYQTSLCASSFCNIMENYLHIGVPMWFACLFWGTAMFITAVYGVKLIEMLNLVSVPALFVLLIWGVIAAVMNGVGGTIGSYEPPQSLGLVYGITLSISAFASGAVICGDYTRYSASRKGTVLSCVIGVLPAGVGALIIGSVLSLSAGSYDLCVVFSNFGLPIVGMLVLILATWTTNTGNAYSSGIAIVNMFKLKDSRRSSMTLLCGALGTVFAMAGIIDHFVVFLNYVGYFVPPVAGVAIADYWIMGKARADFWEPKEGVNWLGVVSWIIGAATAYFAKFFVPTIDGIAAAMIVYCILTAAIKNESINPIAAMKRKQS